MLALPPHNKTKKGQLQVRQGEHALHLGSGSTVVKERSAIGIITDIKKLLVVLVLCDQRRNLKDLEVDAGCYGPCCFLAAVHTVFCRPFG